MRNNINKIDKIKLRRTTIVTTKTKEATVINKIITTTSKISS